MTGRSCSLRAFVLNGAQVTWNTEMNCYVSPRHENQLSPQDPGTVPVSPHLSLKGPKGALWWFPCAGRQLGGGRLFCLSARTLLLPF